MIANGQLAKARCVARIISGVVSERGLDASLLYKWLAVEFQGQPWLIGVLNDRRAKPEVYASANLIHHLSTSLKGLPVEVSNSSGLRYVIALRRPPRLPRLVEFPGVEPGVLLLGVGYSGEVRTTWDEVRHLMVVGRTGTGKSVFLRSIVHQSVQGGARLLLSDLDGTTFSTLQGHPALLAPIATTATEAGSLVSRALAECDRRAALFAASPNFPENLEQYNAIQATEALPRVVVIFDEFNATVTANGGPRGKFAQAVASLGWRGRKFGINLVFAAQAFDKAIVGAVRDQVGGVVAFQVRSKETARNVGVAGAASLPDIPGRATSDRWGLFQSYLLDRAEMVNAASQGQRTSPLPGNLLDLVQWALEENDGYLSLAAIQERGAMGQYQARKLAEEWQRRGWLGKDSLANNRRFVTPELERLSSL